MFTVGKTLFTSYFSNRLPRCAYQTSQSTSPPRFLWRASRSLITPRLVLMIAVEETFLHCPKAIMRGRLWDAEAQLDRNALPSGAEMVSDQLNLGKLPVTNEQIIESYRKVL